MKREIGNLVQKKRAHAGQKSEKLVDDNAIFGAVLTF